MWAVGSPRVVGDVPFSLHPTGKPAPEEMPAGLGTGDALPGPWLHSASLDSQGEIPLLRAVPHLLSIFFRFFCSILINSQPRSGRAANVLSAASLRRDDEPWLVVAN